LAIPLCPNRQADHNGELDGNQDGKHYEDQTISEAQGNRNPEYDDENRYRRQEDPERMYTADGRFRCHRHFYTQELAPTTGYA
jgi:hypothetical protein